MNFGLRIADCGLVVAAIFVVQVISLQAGNAFSPSIHVSPLLLKKGEVEEPVNRLKEEAKANPSDPLIDLQLAQIYRKNGNTDQAIVYLESYIGKDQAKRKKAKENPDTQYLYASLQLAECYRSKKDFTRSLDLYKSIREESERLSEWSPLVSSLEGSARVASDVGKTASAATFYQVAIQMAKKSELPELQMSPWFRYANYLRTYAKEPKLAFAAYLTSEQYIPKNASKQEVDLIKKTRLEFEKTLSKEAPVIRKDLAMYRQKALEYKYPPPTVPTPKTPAPSKAPAKKPA
jgi:tetratricopeptide (TPR) repeat protein